MKRTGKWLGWLAALLVGALLSSCYLETDGGYIYWSPIWNEAPEVLDADARCYWDGYYNDYVWQFEALVDDWDGAWDVDDVWAEVYEAGTYERYAGTVSLTRTIDPHIWFADRLESSTGLWCGEGYVVDFIAEDWWGDTDVLTVRAVESSAWASPIIGH